MQGKTCTVETADILLNYFGFELMLRKCEKQIRANPDKKGFSKANQQTNELKKYHRQSWKCYAKDPYFWYIKAKALYDAANAVRNTFWPKKRERYDLGVASSDFYKGPVYMLLAGLAVETIIKGIIVGRNPEFVKQQKLSKELTHHNLIDLYRTAGLGESRYLNELLLRLQNYVENFGRYPVTITKQDMQKLTNTRFDGQTDPDRIDRLWEHLLPKIQAYFKSEE